MSQKIEKHKIFYFNSLNNWILHNFDIKENQRNKKEVI